MILCCSRTGRVDEAAASHLYKQTILALNLRKETRERCILCLEPIRSQPSLRRTEMDVKHESRRRRHSNISVFVVISVNFFHCSVTWSNERV